MIKYIQKIWYWILYGNLRVFLYNKYQDRLDRVLLIDYLIANERQNGALEVETPNGKRIYCQIGHYADYFCRPENE